MIIEYSTNNSGGSYWLKAKDWKRLAEAGWKLFGFDNFEYDAQGKYVRDEDGLPKRKGSLPDNPHYAFKQFNTIQEALREFEELTGQDVSDEGCNCCGPPHSFNWGECGAGLCSCPKERPHKDYQCASGDALLEYMFPGKDANLTKRQLLERR